MFAPLKHRTFRMLFSAQVIALLGTGLLTVALGLLAWELAGADAGAVLGTALAIKMIAYVGVAPVAGAIAERAPRKTLLILLDLVRASVAIALPFVDQVWQIYVLIFLLQSASAAFTPTFQATIPDILEDEDEYTQALSLSRLAYDLEGLVSPALAAALLSVISFHWLFAGTVLGFVVSAVFVTGVLLPSNTEPRETQPFLERTTRGIRFYMATPRLRGLLGLNLAAAAAGAMVIVNTVVLVRSSFGGSDSNVAVALAAFGAGSMFAALLLPRMLGIVPDRTVMLVGAAGLVAGLILTGTLLRLPDEPWGGILTMWIFLGICYSVVLTPSGRLLRRSCHAPDRPALFAAQFGLSHACWLITYPLAGWLGAEAGLWPTSFALAALAGVGAVTAMITWPATDPPVVEHAHFDLPPDDPHIADARRAGDGHVHAHVFVIDERHARWPG